MAALLDSLAAGFSGAATRRAALDAALRDGLPGARSEAWKYTSLRALERRSFSPAPLLHDAIDPALFADIPAPRLVFANGRYLAADSDLTGLPEGARLLPLSAALADPDPRESNFLDKAYARADEVFARLNAALADDGAVLRVAEGVAIPLPVHLVFVGAPAGGDVAWHSRHFIELRRGASATVIEHHIASSEHAHLGNTLSHVHVATGAVLRHARIQDEAPRATLFTRTDAVLARDATYRRLDLELGAGLSRHELNVRLEGENAELVANGVMLASARRHLDTRLGIQHIARDTRSQLGWRGMAAGRGRSVFHGGIEIREGADGSDARLSNKNLLLSDTAEIDTQPVLVIHAEEVQAAHGATVGQLDPDAMFYLRSRGLAEPEARALLTAAFVREPLLAVVTTPALRTLLEAVLDRAVQSQALA
ncbi:MULTISPECIES: Fe-S cluster assembly protein SufD [unclassified Luteimonas]|uniref:Fe-S cluster assembly protein SufD n=1 Tax=unclassified Luteimonas TaxID=2629088 RepID=UPI0018F09AE8|nr:MULTISPECIES: Fe-S cluster assembly protein SufD [unclassified Luteimonas]MBJ6982557.1 Fe-S cluster assembly protein SufD [Luteimonas sp. MC1572]MBJ7574865.1 Fe-S cluster assembly protein SufD [Luteimonas sp. MC1828]QQO03809.1 Fe-S cluster assembly protein SufD [Luteimonas sp. MC1572]